MQCPNQVLCPHCQEPMLRWANPPLSNWSGEFQFVCFNDECPYFVHGWSWMVSQFHVKASYRWRFDPENGETGPLPVWSKDALKINILSEDFNPCLKKM
jgi:hypothetical protein